MPCMLCHLATFLVLLLPVARVQDPLASQQQAVAAAEQQHGAESLEVAEQLQRLVPLLQSRGDGQQALRAVQRVVAIREAKLPAGHQRIGIALSNLGGVHLFLDDPEQAIPCLLRAKEIFAKNPPGRAMVGALSNLGIAECRLGNYLAAEQYLQAALVEARQHAKDHVYLGLVLQNLAQVKLNLGEIETGKAFVEEALAVFERIDPDGKHLAHAVFGLGVALLAAQRLDEAEPLLRRGLELRERLHGPEHGEVGTVHISLGSLLLRRGQLDEAQRHIDAALRITAARGEARSAATARDLLMQLRFEQRDFTAARQLAVANCARAAALDLSPVQRLECDHNLARVLLELGDHGAAIPILRALLAAVAPREAEWSRLLFQLRSHLACALLRSGDPSHATPLLLDNLAAFHRAMDRMLPALLERERLAEVQRNRKDLERLLECSRLHPQGHDAVAIYGAVLAWKGQVARGMLRQQEMARKDPEGTARLRRLQQIASLISMGRADATILREKAHLESALARSQPATGEEQVAPGALMAALPADAAFVDCALYHDDDGTGRFVAFVVRHTGLRRIELGPSEAIVAAVEKHVLMASRSVRAGAAALTRLASAEAHRLVMAPLTAALGDCESLWISPDDVLATLPFETLPGSAPGSYLVEDLSLGYLQDGFDLLRAPPAAPAAPRLLGLGSIDYGGADEAIAALRGVPRPFPALPQTERELREIVQAVGEPRCDVHRGRAASEANLRTKVSGASFVHLATHGFCGNDVGEGAIPAGIALAGANETAGADDGILSVAEAGLLDLHACRLIVLSACQTGLGKPFAGESLLGLRRALHIAGAGATVTSLWRVDDTATAELMGDFYREMFVTGLPPVRALRRAQLLAIARARAATGEGLPGLWGAFVHEGR